MLNGKVDLKTHEYSGLIKIIKQEVGQRFHTNCYCIEYDHDRLILQLPYLEIKVTFSYNEETVYFRYSTPIENKYNGSGPFSGHNIRTISVSTAVRYFSEAIEEIYSFHKKMDVLKNQFEG